MSRVVCFDFDGVIAQYDGWKGPELEHIGEPMPGILDLIDELVRHRYAVAICTARTDLNPVIQWCEKHKVPAVIVREKPVAMLYVDDRGYRFDGDVAALKQMIKKVAAEGVR